MGIIDSGISAASDLLNDKQLKDDVVANVKKMMLMPETSEYGQGAIPAEVDLSKMSWQELMKLRDKLTNREDQNAVAPYEHRAYARDNSGTPYEAIQQAIATPFYTGAKVINRVVNAAGVPMSIGGSRSDPSWSELGQGIRGALEALARSSRK